MFPDSDRPPSIASAAPPLFAAASAGALPALNILGNNAATVLQRAAGLPAPRPVAHRGARLGLTALGLTLGVGSVFVAKEALVAGREAVKHHPDVAALAGLGALGALLCGGIWWLGTRP
jgi:hypothetical protein